MARCRPWLERQIDLVDPVVVVALGGTAAEWFFGPGARIAMLREQGRAAPLTHEGRRLLVTYHPSAAIRFGPRGRAGGGAARGPGRGRAAGRAKARGR